MDYVSTIKKNAVRMADIPRANPETSSVHSLEAAAISLPFTRQRELSVGQRRRPAPLSVRPMGNVPAGESRQAWPHPQWGHRQQYLASINTTGGFGFLLGSTHLWGRHADLSLL